jgi:two-component system CheB/CheR fusion protein
MQEELSRLKGARLLIVEDDAATLEALQMALEQNGAIVVAAGSLDDAVARLEEGDVELVISDISMPGGDGFALLRRIRAIDAERGHRTPVIAMTGYVGTEEIDAIRAAGFDDHVAKPVSFQVLIDKVDSLRRK